MAGSGSKPSCRRAGSTRSTCWNLPGAGCSASPAVPTLRSVVKSAAGLIERWMWQETSLTAHPVEPVHHGDDEGAWSL